MPDETETLAELLRRYAEPPDNVPAVSRVRFAEALQHGDDPLHILPYFASLGLPVRSIDDLLAINGDETEEEVHSFPVAEGVAVTVASDGLWLLFER